MPKMRTRVNTRHTRDIPEDQCPACGIYYFKYIKYINQKNDTIKSKPQNHKKPAIKTGKVATNEVLIKSLNILSLRIKIWLQFILRQTHYIWNKVIKNPVVISSLVISSLMFGLFWVVAPAYMKDKVVGLLYVCKRRTPVF